MAQYYEPTASGFADRFRNNDVENNEWEVGQEEWESMDGWTASECRTVVEAAKSNTSIRRLDAQVFGMSDKALDVFSSVVSQLDQVEHVLIDKPPAAAEPGPEPAAPPPKALERLVAAIAKCPSDVRTFEFRTCCSPRALWRVAEGFSRLDTLDLDGPCRSSGRGCRACCASHEFAVAFGAAMGRLASLRHVKFSWQVPHPNLPQLLSALHTSPTLKEMTLDLPAGSNALVRSAGLFCACTRTVQTLVCCGHPFSSGFVGMSPFFDLGPVPSFSPAMTEMQFFQCSFHDGKPKSLVNRAAKAMSHVEFLRFGRCYFPSGLKVLEKMPRLKKFSCVSRPSVQDPYEPIDEGDYDSYAYVLQQDADLEDICCAVERQGSLLEDVELDVISTHGEDVSYPSIERLMGASRGILVLNLGELPWRSTAHIVNGASRLGRDLRELRLRFANCDFDDNCYADIFQSFGSNKSLAALELGFDGYADLDSCELSLAAIRGLVESNDTLQMLSFRGLGGDAIKGIFEQVLPALGTTNRTLRTLELDGATDCWPFARGPVLDMLKENRVFSKLEGITIPAEDLAAHLLRQNGYGRRLLHANDSSPIGIWSTVLARVSDGNAHEVMYAFLRSKPGLVRSMDLGPRGRQRARKRSRSAG